MSSVRDRVDNGIYSLLASDSMSCLLYGAPVSLDAVLHVGGRRIPWADVALWILAWRKEHGLNLSSFSPLRLGTLVQNTTCTTLCHPYPVTASDFGIRLSNDLVRKLSIGKSRNTRMADVYMSVCSMNGLSQASHSSAGLPCAIASPWPWSSL